MNKKILTIGLILIVMLAAMPSGSAAASCSGSGCDNLDPVAQGCTSNAFQVGAYTYNYGISGSVTGALWYSNNCNSNWAVATSNSGTRYVRAEILVYKYHWNWAYSTSVNSTMADGSIWHCAVGFIDTTNRTPYYNTFSGHDSLAAACG